MRSRALAIILTLAFPLASCAAFDPPEDTAHDFYEYMTTDLEVDYDKLDSPEQAMKVADYVFTGDVRGVADGVEYWQEDLGPSEEQFGPLVNFTTLEMEVVEVIKGDIQPGQNVPIQVVTAQSIDENALRNLAPDGLILVLATNEEEADRGDGVSVKNIAALNTFSDIAVALPDGLWSHDTQGLISPHRDGVDLLHTWGVRRDATLDDLVASLDSARSSSE